jgi:hypothetical protein
MTAGQKLLKLNRSNQPRDFAQKRPLKHGSVKPMKTKLSVAALAGKRLSNPGSIAAQFK